MWEVKVDRSFKLILLGESGVGKTSIVNRRCYHNFSDRTILTVGVASVSTIVEMRHLKIELKIWDTPGWEQYSSPIPMFCRNTDICLLVIDATRLETIENLGKWEGFLAEVGCHPPKIIVFNKLDLAPGLNPCTHPRVMELAASYERHVLVSAKCGMNVDELFRTRPGTCSSTETHRRTQALNCRRPRPVPVAEATLGSFS
jgi:small GTP-binding protein